MTKLLQIYKCSVCGNIVEVVHASGGELVCCNKPMILLAENSTDAATEKHVPVVEQVDSGVKVAVGSVLHPMADDHYIEWIELIVGGKALRQALKPGDEPVAMFEGVQSSDVLARAYCNLHGLWKSL